MILKFIKYEKENNENYFFNIPQEIIENQFLNKKFVFKTVNNNTLTFNITETITKKEIDLVYFNKEIEHPYGVCYSIIYDFHLEYMLENSLIKETLSENFQSLELISKQLGLFLENTLYEIIIPNEIENKIFDIEKRIKKRYH